MFDCEELLRASAVLRWRAKWNGEMSRGEEGHRRRANGSEREATSAVLLVKQETEDSCSRLHRPFGSKYSSNSSLVQNTFRQYSISNVHSGNLCDVWDESLQRWISVSKVEGAVDGRRVGWVFKGL